MVVIAEAFPGDPDKERIAFLSKMAGTIPAMTNWS